MMYLYSHRGTLVLVLVWQSPWALYINFILTWYEFVALELYAWIHAAVTFVRVSVLNWSASLYHLHCMFVCYLFRWHLIDWSEQLRSLVHPVVIQDLVFYEHLQVHHNICTTSSTKFHFVLNILLVSKEITLLCRRNHRSSVLYLYLAIQLLSADNTTCACCIACCITCTGTLNKGI